MKPARRMLVIGIVALALAGCAPGGGAAPTATASYGPVDPAVREADCGTLVAALNGAMSAMLQADPDALKDDPQGALDLLDQAVADVDDAVDGLIDQELKDAATDTSTVIHGYIETLRGAAADPDSIDKTLMTAQTALVADQLSVVSGLCS